MSTHTATPSPRPDQMFAGETLCVVGTRLRQETPQRVTTSVLTSRGYAARSLCALGSWALGEQFALGARG